MNMPTVGSGSVEKSRLVTTRLPAGPSKKSSTPPPLFGAPNAAAIMSSNAFDSRGFSVNDTTGGVPGQSPTKQRYVATTSRFSVYDVLNARTSVKNGDRPWSEADAGSVTVSAAATAAHRLPASTHPEVRMAQVLPVRTQRPETSNPGAIVYEVALRRRARSGIGQGLPAPPVFPRGGGRPLLHGGRNGVHRAGRRLRDPRGRGFRDPHGDQQVRRVDRGPRRQHPPAAADGVRPGGDRGRGLEISHDRHPPGRPGAVVGGPPDLRAAVRGVRRGRVPRLDGAQARVRAAAPGPGFRSRP